MTQPRSRENLQRSLYETPLALKRYREWLTIFAFRCFYISIALTTIGLFFKIPALFAVGILLATFSFSTLVPIAFMRFAAERRLDVSAERFRLDHGNGQVESFELKDVEHVRLRWLTVIFSRLTIYMKDGRKLRLSPAWDRFDYVLDLLKNAQPELTSFTRYDRYRIRCIAADHMRTRAASELTQKHAFWMVARMSITWLLAAGFVLSLKALGLGEGVFPSTQNIVGDAFLASVVVWAVWAYAEEVALFRVQLKRLEADPQSVKRDRIEEAKFKVTYGTQSWLAFWAVIALACVGCAFGLN